jgi:hypothetical protein
MLILKVRDIVPALLLSPDSSHYVVPELLRQQQRRAGVAAEKSVIAATMLLWFVKDLWCVVLGGSGVLGSVWFCGMVRVVPVRTRQGRAI